MSLFGCKQRTVVYRASIGGVEDALGLLNRLIMNHAGTKATTKIAAIRLPQSLNVAFSGVGKPAIQPRRIEHARMKNSTRIIEPLEGIFMRFHIILAYST